MVNNNEFDDNLDKRANGERANEDVGKAFLNDVQQTPDAAVAKEMKDATQKWGESMKDGSYKEKTESVQEAVANPAQYLEQLKKLDEKTLRDMLEQNEQAIKNAKFVVSSIGSRLPELASKL